MSARSPQARASSPGEEVVERQEGNPLNVRETAFLFDCGGESLPAIIAAPTTGALATGVVVVVGGPQYRAGSHRQFVLLARGLAAAGVPCLRFDYRGMGDATGAQRDFEAVGDDIGAAVAVFFARQPGLQRVVLWGLCDGASAACLYAAGDARVAGMVLLNPWVRTVAGEARTQLRHYYFQRILEPAFWRKLFGGGVALGRSLGGLMTAARAARTPAGGGTVAAADLPTRMADALAKTDCRYAIFLSTRDYVAREFEDLVTRSPRWRALADAAVSGLRRFEADHTFSTMQAKAEVARASLELVLDVHQHEGASQ